MAFLIPSYFQKRLLHYALSRLEVLDTDALDLERLDVGWGKRSTIELRDVELRRDKVAALLHLPPTFDLATARVALVRVTIPADIHVSPISIELNQIDVLIRQLDKVEEKPPHAPRSQSRSRAKRRRGAWGPSSGDAEDSDILPSTQDLAKSFLAEESKSEREQLQAALTSQTTGLDQSIASSTTTSDEDPAGGYGVGLNLPGFLAGFLRDIANRVELHINNVCLSVQSSVELNGLECRSLFEESRFRELTLRISIEKLDVHGITSNTTVIDEMDTLSDETNTRRGVHATRVGKRQITLEGIRGSLVCDEALYTRLFHSREVRVERPDQDSPVNSWSKAHDQQAESAYPEGFSDGGSSHGPETSPLAHDHVDFDKFADADESESGSVVVSGNVPRMEPEAERMAAFEDAEDSYTTYAADNDFQYRGNDLESRREGSFGNLQDVLKSFRAERRVSTPVRRKASRSRDRTVSPPRTPTAGATEELLSHDQSQIPTIDQPGNEIEPSFGEEDLTQSMFFSHEQAASMYMSVHEPQEPSRHSFHIPGAWEEQSEPTLGISGQKSPEIPTDSVNRPGLGSSHSHEVVPPENALGVDAGQSPKPYPFGPADESDQLRIPAEQNPASEATSTCCSVELLWVSRIRLFIPGIGPPSQDAVSGDQQTDAVDSSQVYSPSSSRHMSLPGEFSIYSESSSRRRSSSATKARPQISADSSRQGIDFESEFTSDQIEVCVDDMRSTLDIMAVSLTGQTLKKLASSVSDQDSSDSKTRKPQMPSRQDFQASPLDLQVRISKLEVLLLKSLGEGSAQSTTDVGKVMFALKGNNVSMHQVSSSGMTDVAAVIGSISFGFEDEDILRFDELAKSASLIREPQYPGARAIKLDMRISPKAIDTSISTLPVALHVDLDRLDETVGSLGGLSGLIELGSSIFLDSTGQKVTPTPSPISKGRSVRFHTPDSSTSQTFQPARVKTNLRIGGVSARVRDRRCDILYESTAVKFVARDSGFGVQIDESRLSGPRNQQEATEPAALLLRLRNTSLKYLLAPEEGDLTRLISLLTPSKDKFEAEDDFLVDTLISQRRKGPVLRASVEKVDLSVNEVAPLKTLRDFLDDVGRFSSLTKYLPQESRPGLLTLVGVKLISIRLETHKKIGSLSLSLGGTDVAHIGAPLLIAVGAESLTLKTGGEVVVVKEVVPYRGTDNPLMLMGRMIGDELEPTLKLKLWNTCVEYSVPLMIAVQDLVGEDDTDRALLDIGASVVSLADQVNPTKPPRRVSSASPSASSDAKPLRLDIAFRDCAIGLNPNHLASKALVLLTDTQVTGTVPDAHGLKAVFEFRRAAVLLTDDKTRLVDSVETAPDKASLNDTGARHIAALCKQGFVNVLSLSSASAVLELVKRTADSGNDCVDLEFKNELFLLETCADSTKTLGEVFGALSPPSKPTPGERYRTQIAPVMDMMASFTGDAFPIVPTEKEELFDYDAEDVDEFADEELEADLVKYGDFGDMEQSLGSDVGTEELSKAAQTLFLDDPQSQTVDPVHGIDDARSEILGGSVVPSAMPPRVEGTAHKWDSTRNRYIPLSPGDLARSPVRVRIRDMHIIWNLYDGYDWERTRDAITQAVEEVEAKAEERRSKRRSHGGEDDDKEPVIEDFLFNSIYIGIPAQNDPRELSRKINRDLDDLVSETGTQLSTTPSRPSVLSRAPRSQNRRLKLERSKRRKITFELKRASADIFQFSPGGETQQSIDVRVGDLEIFDHVPTSTWKKFATYMRDYGSREDKKPMVHIEICNVKPVPDLTASELVLRVTVLPLRLHIDQDALDFMTRFFEFSDSNSTQPPTTAPAEQPYLQRVEVRAIPVKLDYKPKKIDYAGLRSGRTTEFMNFFILDGADMVLRHAIVYGCSGMDKLHHALEDVWMPDIRTNQLPGVLSGLNGVRTLVNMGTGVRDLVVVPVREYRKDGRVVRSVSKGALAFARTTGSELTRFGAKLAIGAQSALQGAEDFFNRASSSPATPALADWDDADLDPDERRAISRYADQPTGILQGLKGAARSLERDLLVTRDVIIAVSGEVRESGSAEGVARAVARHAPTLILRPMIGASKAVGQALMGATNSVDPGNRRRMEDKYKSY